MPTQTFPTYGAQVSEFVAMGDTDLLGGTQLTMLLEGFRIQTPPSLEDLFPTEYVASRTLIFEQFIESVGIAPVVNMGVVTNTQLSTHRRGRKRFATPAFTREDIFIEDSAVNDLRAPGTFNDRVDPAAMIAKKIEAAYMRRNELILYMRYQALLGGINYVDARTQVEVKVSTGIPPHNFFSYNGWGGTYPDGTAVGALAAGAPVPSIGDGNTYVALGPLVPVKGRQEALLFTDINLNIGVPWTSRQADIASTIRRIKTWLGEVNKVDGWEIYMGSALYDCIQGNDLIRRSSGQTVFVGNMDVVAGGRNQIIPVDGIPSPVSSYVFANGDLDAISGCKITVVRGRFTDPMTGKDTLYWPPHQIALIAPRSTNGGNESIGMTWHCMGESAQTVGPWIRSTENPAPPALPGVAIQMGDAFLPIVKYPHWISIVNVCEPKALNSGLYNDNLFAYGNSYSLF
jgi:Phage major capsid protein E